MAVDLPPRPHASDIEDALTFSDALPAESRTRQLAAEVLHLRARVATLRTPPAGEAADAWLQEIIDDRPEGAYEGRDVYDHRGAQLALHELIALRARVAEMEGASNSEPDYIEDGVEVWDVGRGLNVARDGTSRIHGPTYRIGGREVPVTTLRALASALAAVLHIEKAGA